MQIDLIGRVSNIKLPLTRALSPLFEAIVNSFQAIEDLKDKDNTYINIYIERDNTQTDLKFDFQPINNFVIEDNGIGFNEENFVSFETSDSMLKSLKGGKGIGRFLWLKAFQSVNINSIFEQDGTAHERNFNFRLDGEGVFDKKIEKIDKAKRKTSVKLNNFEKSYKEKCPKKIDTVAAKIIEHCLVYFLNENCPMVTLYDETETINLNQLFIDTVKSHSMSETFQIKKHTFNVINLHLFSSEETQHRVHFCANNREVVSINLNSFIPNLIKKIKDEKDNDKPFLYVAYISGKYLDENVNTERTEFALSDDPSIDDPEELSKKQLIEYAVEKVKSYLDKYLEPIRHEKLEQITNYIRSKSPQFNPILKYKQDALDSIAPNLSDDKLELELYKIFHKTTLDLRNKGEEFLRTDLKNVKDLPKYKEQYKKFIEQINDFGKANLAQYIIHRKLILDLLNNNLKLDQDGKYNLEESIHSIIFPVGVSSAEIDYENHNLWIIDERLSYHSYLASDKSLSQSIDTKSKKEPDLIVFNEALAFGDETPYSSIVIIEFKRPGRADYDYEKKNPINQVYDYILSIKDKKQKTKDGRPITIRDNTPFFGYIICDINDKIEKMAGLSNLTKTPDGEGYFGNINALNAYIEIISYNKLLQDAVKRNKILFQKLNLPTL